MRSRMLAGAVMLVLAVGGLLVPASQAGANCGHDRHQDEYHNGGIYWGNGTYIRTGPHLGCTAIGQGYPGDGINVHCVIKNQHTNFRIWVFVRDLQTGKRGWAREDSLRVPSPTSVGSCVQVGLYHTVDGN